MEVSPYGNGTLNEGLGKGKEFIIDIPLEKGIIKSGSNKISITTLQGSWVMFDQIRFEGPGGSKLVTNQNVFIHSISAAEYEIESLGKTFQPLLLNIEHIKNSPDLKVFLDEEMIFSKRLEFGAYEFEVPMPSVKNKVTSQYEVFIDELKVKIGTVIREPNAVISPSGYVNTMMGAAHSRWMIAPGPWMPFSMVKLSPDNQNKGWQAGYDPIFESIAGFSHIHEWTLSGLLTMPTIGPLQTKVGDQFEPIKGYRSRIDKNSEEASLGYYKVKLTDYDILAELTSTTRCSFQKYSFPEGEKARILLDLYFPSEYDFNLEEVQIEKISDNRVEGYSKQVTPNAWSGGITQDYTIHFVIEFDQPITNSGVWTEKEILDNEPSLKTINPKDAGMYVEFNNFNDRSIQLRTGISYVSIENAAENLEKEISNPFGWDFYEVVKSNRKTWDEILGRIEIESTDRREKVWFYSNLYRSFCRNTFSDIDGSWVDPDEKIQVLQNSEHLALGYDAFWNTFWNLNQLWNLVTPEWSSKWVNSQLTMFDTHGWLAKGPAGMEYIPVMVAEHEIPLIVGAYQMGIRDFDVEKAYRAIKKMQTTPGTSIAGGYAGNRDLESYLKYKYVPSNLGRYSNSLEYSFDDWSVSQLALTLNKEEDYKFFSKRGTWWQNTIDPESGYDRLKESTGAWVENFDPFKTGANHQYVEGNASQLTFFVPQDIPGLISNRQGTFP